MDQPQSVHKIKTTLFYISLPKLGELQSLTQESTNYDYESAEYRVTVIILDMAQYRLLRPVCSDLGTSDKTHFIRLNFINKDINAVDLLSVLISNNNKKRSHTQLDSRKQVIAFQDRVITINIKEAQHPLKREKQVIDKSSIMLKISTKCMHRVLV